ncbi:hypothetical protein BVG19_g3982 [[Candida] boidinii]|nr:hypothetical protein BVG19_g3982 [[Candida] boidinii]OWB52847.1 hypothetical protein B5S27_g4430 [[Candida] boidinii]
MTSSENTLFINYDLNEQSTFPFLNTNPDLIAFHLIDYLDKDDIISLFLTCKKIFTILNQSFVWHKLFKKTFNESDTPYKMTIYKWPQLYRLRSRSKLLVWGHALRSRLGFQFNELNNSQFELKNGFRRVVKLIKISDKQLDNEIVADITSGGFSFQVLTSSGKLYCTGNSLGSWHGSLGVCEPGPRVRDPQFQPLVQTNSFMGNIYPVTISDPNSDNSKENNTRKHISVSSGRGHFISLDNEGSLWSWDSVGQKNQGIELKLYGLNNELLVNDADRKIVLIKAGWRSSSALISNLGTVVWNKRDNVRNDRRSDESANDLPHLDNHPTANVKCRIVSNTKNIGNDFEDDSVIVDYVVLDGFLVYITALGNLFRVNLDHLNDEINSSNYYLKSYHLMGFEKYIKEFDGNKFLKPKFIRLSGSYNKFSCITNSDLVLLGDSDSKFDSPPKIIDFLQHRGCISIEVGDYHYLALLQNGELYSWGCESSLNGCLGLGRVDDMVRNGARRDGIDIRVTEPTRVPTRGKVLAIAAGGHQSAAIVAFDSEDEDDDAEDIGVQQPTEGEQESSRHRPHRVPITRDLHMRVRLARR